MDFKRQDSNASMDDYCLDRLFDPEELYYTPMDELLKRYKTRNLRPGRMFNMAKRYGHIQPSRKRNIIAPLTNIYEVYGDGIVKTKKLTCTSLKKNENNQNQQSKEGLSDPEANGEQKQIRHANWLQERKQLRNGLNNLDLNREYLQRKKKLNECELRVLKQLEDANETQDSKKNNHFKTNKKELTIPSNEETSKGKIDSDEIDTNNTCKITAKLPRLNLRNSQVDGNVNFDIELQAKTKAFDKMTLEEKKAELFIESLNCYKKASLLEIVNDKVLKKALIFPEEIRSACIVDALKEKATNEKNEKRLQRYLMKRGKLFQ